MGHFRNIAGQKFSFLTVIETIAQDPTKKPRGVKWRCRCICGTITTALTNSLISRKKQSCGCLKGHLISKRKIKHGHSVGTKITTEYRIWTNMMTRCYNKSNSAWPSYGGRGISVCERWHSFSNFISDVGPRPSPKHTIDRIDNDGNYEPSNVRWATKKEQARNRTSGRYLFLDGRNLTIAEWSEISGIKHSTICYRLDHGWPLEKIFSPIKS